MKKNDILLIVAALVLAAGVFIWFKIGQDKGTPAWVIVSVDGMDIARYPLDEDKVYTLNPHEGQKNVLEIKDGFVQIVESDCSDHICEYQGKISKNGELIVCLPHGLIVTVESNEQSTNDSVVK